MVCLTKSDTILTWVQQRIFLSKITGSHTIVRTHKTLHILVEMGSAAPRAAVIYLEISCKGP